MYIPVLFCLFAFWCFVVVVFVDVFVDVLLLFSWRGGQIKTAVLIMLHLALKYRTVRSGPHFFLLLFFVFSPRGPHV